MSIGTKIAKLRTSHKLSQEELGYKIGVAQTSVSNFESDKTTPDFLIMHKICETFGVGFEYFLEEKNVYNVEKNIGAVGNYATVNNYNAPEGIIENMLRRIEVLEKRSL